MFVWREERFWFVFLRHWYDGTRSACLLFFSCHWHSGCGSACSCFFHATATSGVMVLVLFWCRLIQRHQSLLLLMSLAQRRARLCFGCHRCSGARVFRVFLYHYCHVTQQQCTCSACSCFHAHVARAVFFCHWHCGNFFA